MKPPIIETFKRHKDFLNIVDILNLPSDTPYGNLTLKWVDIMQRFDNINDKIIEIYDCFEKMIENQNVQFNPLSLINNTKYFSKQRNLIEELVYWLRKSADEFIALMYVLEKKNLNEEYPEKIEIESIGKLLKNKDLNATFFSEFYSLLGKLNDISNTYKHSFINSDASNLLGAESPFVFALNLKGNKLSNNNKPSFYTINLTEFLSEYCTFTDRYKDEITKYLVHI